MSQRVKRAERKRRQAERVFDPNGRFRIECDPGHVVYRGDPERGGEPLRFATREAAEKYMLEAGWDHMRVISD